MPTKKINNGEFQGDQTAESIYESFNKVNQNNTLVDNLEIEIENVRGEIPRSTLPDANVTAGIVEGDLENAPNNASVYDAFFNDGILRENDLILEDGFNLFDTSKIQIGAYVNNVGTISFAANWELIRIDISKYEVGTDFTIGKIDLTTGGFWVFNENENDGKITNGSFSPNSTRVLNKPLNANFLLVTIKRPTDNSSAYANATINIGNELLEPYQPFSVPKLIGIKGFEIEATTGGQGEAYDQSLNTFDDVEFSSLKISSMVVDIPIGAGIPPDSVEIGDAWIDSENNGSIQVKLA